MVTDARSISITGIVTRQDGLTITIGGPERQAVFQCSPTPLFSFKLVRVISLSGLQLSGLIHLYPVKMAVMGNVILRFSQNILLGVFMENTNNFVSM